MVRRAMARGEWEVSRHRVSDDEYGHRTRREIRRAVAAQRACKSSHSRKHTERGESGLLLPALLTDQMRGIYR